MKKVISYSLYGDNPKYIEGLKHNVNLLDEIYLDPSWVMRVYYDDSVPSDKLVSHDRVEYVKVENDVNYMFWRFYAWDDPDVEVYLCRDIDDRLNMWDYNMICEWEKTNHNFTVGRCHESHNTLILGGLWGGKPQNFSFNMKGLVDEFQGRHNTTQYNDDQIFLSTCIWPLVKSETLSFGLLHGAECADHVNIPLDCDPLKSQTPISNAFPWKDGFMIKEHVRAHMCGVYEPHMTRYEDHWNPGVGYQSEGNHLYYKNLYNELQNIQEINNPEDFDYFGHAPDRLVGNKFLFVDAPKSEARASETVSVPLPCEYTNDSISVVVVARNDNYGGSLNHRAKHCLNTLIENYDEVIYVDWKSPDIPLTSAIEDDLIKSGKLKVYVVEPEDIINNNPEYINYPLVEVVGRNIGIRRASCDWVLTTNIDVMIERIDLSKYRDDTLYTAARRNVPQDNHLTFTNTKELLSHLDSCKHGYAKSPDSVAYDENGAPFSTWDPGDIWSLVVNCGDFQFAHKNIWESIKGFEERFGGRMYTDSNVLKKASIHHRIEKVDENLYHLDHGNDRGAFIEGEVPPPHNDRLETVNNFTETSNEDTWGWQNYNLASYII